MVRDPSTSALSVLSASTSLENHDFSSDYPFLFPIIQQGHRRGQNQNIPHALWSFCLQLWFSTLSPVNSSKSKWSCWWCLCGRAWNEWRAFIWSEIPKETVAVTSSFFPACYRLLRFHFITVSGNKVRAICEWSVMLYGKINVINCAVWLLVDGRGITLDQSLCSGKKKIKYFFALMSEYFSSLNHLLKRTRGNRNAPLPSHFKGENGTENQKCKPSIRVIGSPGTDVFSCDWFCGCLYFCGKLNVSSLQM